MNHGPLTYRIAGLPYEPFTDLFALSDGGHHWALAVRGAMRVTASADRGFPCRVALKDAKAGDRMILLHHVSHDLATPYRSAYAIYVGEGAFAPAPYVDCVPPVFAGRPLGLRGFSAGGMLLDAKLALPDEADAGIRALLANTQIASIHAHNAAHGCFVARIERPESIAP